MKISKNPLIATISENTKARTLNLGSLESPKELGKVCVWCLGPLRGQQRRWCSSECVFFATAFANPQKEESLSLLLLEQNFKCKVCDFDFSKIVEEIYSKPEITYRLTEIKDSWKTKPSMFLAIHLKRTLSRSHKDRRLEVDHIMPIYKGGSPFERANLQAICYCCHKIKTKIDNSGPRPKNPEKERKKILTKNFKLVSNKACDYRKGDFTIEMSRFYLEILSLEELTLYLEYFDTIYPHTHTKYRDELRSFLLIRLDRK